MDDVKSVSHNKWKCKYGWVTTGSSRRKQQELAAFYRPPRVPRAGRVASFHSKEIRSVFPKLSAIRYRKAREGL